MAPSRLSTSRKTVVSVCLARSSTSIPPFSSRISPIRRTRITTRASVHTSSMASSTLRLVSWIRTRCTLSVLELSSSIPSSLPAVPMVVCSTRRAASIRLSIRDRIRSTSTSSRPPVSVRWAISTWWCSLATAERNMVWAIRTPPFAMPSAIRP